MQGENGNKGSNGLARSTAKEKVRFLVGGKVFYPNSSGENATHVNHGNERPRSTSHKQGAEPSKVREVRTNDDGARKEIKHQEQNSDKGYKRSRSTSHKQGAEPAKVREVGTNDFDRAKKEMKPQEQNSDKGNTRPRSTSHKQGAEPSKVREVGNNYDDGARMEMKPQEQNSDKGNKRPKPCHNQGAKPSKVREVGTNDDYGARKEMKPQEQKSDKGNKRPRSSSHNQGAEPSKVREVCTNDDDGARKKMKPQEQKSDKGNRRPRSTSHNQGAEPSKVREVGTNDDYGARKERKPQEQKRDKGAGHHGLKVHTSSSSENLQMYPPNCPAQRIIWKGCFEVIGNIPEEDMDCEEFLAHPPAKLILKAYEFSKKFPQTMQFRMYSRHMIWPKIFQIACPNSSDIALYFFPEKSQRSRKMYERLLKYIEANDMALRSCIGSVELLVFASKLLDMDSRSKILFCLLLFCLEKLIYAARKL